MSEQVVCGICGKETIDGKCQFPNHNVAPAQVVHPELADETSFEVQVLKCLKLIIKLMMRRANV